VTVSTNAFIEAKVTGSIDAVPTPSSSRGHDMGSLGQGQSMTYDHYRTVLKGLTPKDAPTYSPSGNLR
jgi:hypothetical protein